MPKFLTYAAVVLLGQITAPVRAAPPVDPLLGARLVDAVATSDRLWVRNDQGAVVAFNRKNGTRRVFADKGVLDLSLDGSQVLALRSTAAGNYEVADLVSGRIVAPKLIIPKPPLALINGRILVVLAPDAVYTLTGKTWRARTLDMPIGGAPQTVTAVDASGRIYLGRNRGEWGGGLFSIDPETGKVTEVRRIDGEPCDGPLGQECDPVTGIVPDRVNAECVLASVGLSHFFAHGRILRVCASKVDVLFSQAIPSSPGAREPNPSTWPFFGLARTVNGWVAVSQGRMFRSADGRVTENPLPSLKPWHGLMASFVAKDVIILATDVNWGQSLSGRTPLLVSVTP